MAQAAAPSMAGEEKLRFGEWLRASSPPRSSSKISTSAEAIQSTKKTSSGGNDSAEINPPSAVTQTSTKQGEGAVAVEVIQVDVREAIHTPVYQLVQQLGMANETLEGMSCTSHVDTLSSCNPVVSQLHVLWSTDLL
ncbi:hypothetical protein ACOSQ2_021774 [Xanthoceras sorbifolium]